MGRLSGFLAGAFKKRPVFADEKDYYTWLFTKSGMYSSGHPNWEEAERWRHIRILIEIARAGNGGRPFRHILDFGCGRGWMLPLLSAYGKATGIDPVPAVIAYGKSLFKQSELLVGDIGEVGRYEPDLIICSEVIEHMGHADRVLFFSSAFTHLMPGGYLLLTTPRREVWEEWTEKVNADQPKEDWLTESEVQGHAFRTGFALVHKLNYSEAPDEQTAPIEVYQQWLLQKAF